MIVLFGKGGAGKNTISSAIMSLLQKDGILTKTEVTNIDLDIYIPYWMKSNFIKGLYPTLSQRKNLITIACDNLHANIYDKKSQTNSSAIFAIITFSFINDDTRRIFRENFPHAIWVLVDVSEKLSQKRMENRVGHFYKGEVRESRGMRSLRDNDISPIAYVEPISNSEANNNYERNFSRITFPHVVLDGTESVESNAKRVVAIVYKSFIHQL